MASEAAGGGLKQCLTDLSCAEKSGDYEKALQVCNRMIKRFPKEFYVLKCKLASLIQLGQYDDAWALIKKTPPSHMGDCGFEKAYILYRQGKNEEALELLNGLGDDHRATELRAQISYKLERFQEAYDLFGKLLKGHSDESDDLRKANFFAVQAQLESKGVPQKVLGKCETFEQFYNIACLQIEASKFDEAYKNLDKSIEVCKESLTEEGLTEEEIEEELTMLRVQRAFVLQKLGRRAEALDIYKKVQSAGTSDASVKATVYNNMSGASEGYNLPEARKRLKTALQVDQTKLSYRQRRTLMLNNALVLLLSNQREPCRKSLEELNTKFGPSQDSKLIEAALLVKLNDVEKAAKALEGGDFDQDLFRIHILINNGKLEEALIALNQLPNSIRSKLSILTLKSSILIALDNKDDALLEIEIGLSSTKDKKTQQALLEQAAELETSRNNAAGAAKYLEKLAEIAPKDIAVQCRLIRAYSECNPKKAEELSAKVFPDKPDDSVNVDELEESDWILYGEKYKMKKEAKMEVEESQIVTRKMKNRKKKRKTILPKNYDPKVPPDPERWLPLRERSTFKKKGGRRNRDRDIGRGTQGSASVNPNMEFSAATPNSPRPLATPAAEGPRQMRPKQQPKKKKKGAKF